MQVDIWESRPDVWMAFATGQGARAGPAFTLIGGSWWSPSSPVGRHPVAFAEQDPGTGRPPSARPTWTRCIKATLYAADHKNYFRTSNGGSGTAWAPRTRWWITIPISMPKPAASMTDQCLSSSGTSTRHQEQGSLLARKTRCGRGRAIGARRVATSRSSYVRLLHPMKWCRLTKGRVWRAFRQPRRRQLHQLEPCPGTGTRQRRTTPSPPAWA